MGLKFRQVRKFYFTLIFLFIAVFLLMAKFSKRYSCQNRLGENCAEEVTEQRLDEADHNDARREVQQLIQGGQTLEGIKTGPNVPKASNRFRRMESDSVPYREIPDQHILPREKIKPFTTAKRVITLSKEVRNFEVKSMFIQIKEADSPKFGDFRCSATTVPDCCAFTVSDTNEAKRICEAFGVFCKGFVMSTISSKADSFEYVMYLKKDLNGTMANFLTDFFIKVDFLDELKWNNKR